MLCILLSCALVMFLTMEKYNNLRKVKTNFNEMIQVSYSSFDFILLTSSYNLEFLLLLIYFN